MDSSIESESILLTPAADLNPHAADYGIAPGDIQPGECSLREAERELVNAGPNVRQSPLE